MDLFTSSFLRRGVAALLLLPLVVSTALPAHAATITSPPVLSMLINPKSEPTTTLQDYYDAASFAQQAGATGLLQSASWSDLEPTQGNYTLGSLTDVLDTATQPTILVNLRVLNTTSDGRPAYLASTSFASPVMMTRFHRLIDQLKPHLNSRVAYLAIGNEVDVWLSLHPDQWQAYNVFFKDAVSYVHRVAPNIKVGVTTTYGAYTGSDKAHLLTLNALADIWIVTYYPIGFTFIPRAATAPLTELPWLVGLAGNKQVVLQEVGYPSATALNSSEQAQADFVTNVFIAWQKLGNKVPFLNYVLMHDVTQATCNAYAASYGLSNMNGINIPNWTAYFCSLGLRQSNGTPKLAWARFLTDSARFRDSLT